MKWFVQSFMVRPFGFHGFTVASQSVHRQILGHHFSQKVLKVIRSYFDWVNDYNSITGDACNR